MRVAGRRRPAPTAPRASAPRRGSRQPMPTIAIGSRRAAPRPRAAGAGVVEVERHPLDVAEELVLLGLGARSAVMSSSARHASPYSASSSSKISSVGGGGLDPAVGPRSPPSASGRQQGAQPTGHPLLLARPRRRRASPRAWSAPRRSAAARRPAAAELGEQDARRARPASGGRRPASPAAAGRWPGSSRLRSSTAASESKPRSWNGRSGPTAAADAWPSTAATWVRTRSSTTPLRGRPRAPSASRCGSDPPAGSAALVRHPHQPAQQGRQHPGRAPAPAAPPGPAAPAPAAPRPARRRWSNSARPCSAVSAVTPDPLQPGQLGARRGRRSCRWPRAHRPQASETAGRPGRPALRGQRVQEGVGGGVVGLARAAEQRRRRGEQHERATAPVPRSARAGAGGVHLGPQDPVDLLGGQRLDHAVVEHAGGVHDRGQRLVRRPPAARPAGPGRRRRRRRPGLGRRARPAPRPAPATPGASAPRRLASSRCCTPCRSARCRATSAPSAPVPPVISTVPPASSGPPGPAVSARPSRGASQPARRAPRAAARRAPAARPSPGRCSPSVSRSRNRPGCSDCALRTRPQTAAWRRVRGLPRRRPPLPGQHDQPRLAEPLVGQPPLDQRERLDRRAAGGPGRVAGSRVHGRDDDVRGRPALGQAALQVRQVGEPLARHGQATEHRHPRRRRRGRRDRRPVQLEQGPRAGPPGRLQLRRLDRADVQPGHLGDRRAVVAGDAEPQRGRPRPGRCAPAAGWRRSGAAAPRPGERQPRPGCRRPGRACRARVQRGVEQRRVQPEAVGRTGHPRAATTSAKTSSPPRQAACRPGRPGRSRSRVARLACWRPVVEGVDGERLGAGRRPRAAARAPPARCRRPASRGRGGRRARLVVAALRAGVDGQLAAAVVAGRADGDLDLDGCVVLRAASGASSVSSSTTGQPTWRAGGQGQLDERRAGQQDVPRTAWSASQGGWPARAGR